MKINKVLRNKSKRRKYIKPYIEVQEIMHEGSLPLRVTNVSTVPEKSLPIADWEASDDIKVALE